MRLWKHYQLELFELKIESLWGEWLDEIAEELRRKRLEQLPYAYTWKT